MTPMSVAISAVTVISPLMRAVGEIFAFPDGNFVLDPVYDMLVGFIGLMPMGCGRDHHHCRLADGQAPDTVLGDGYPQPPFLPGFCQYIMDHFYGQRGIGFIFQTGHVPTLVAVSYFAAEEDDGSGARMMGLAQQVHDVQRLGSDDLNGLR